MPFRLPFNFPFFNYNPRNNNNFASHNFENQQTLLNNSISKVVGEKKEPENLDTSGTFFEIFGLKLYFDDIIIMCILFFLYNEKVKDDELFICLILLLLS